MMRYMPPRTFVSFGNMPPWDPGKLLDQLNKELAKKNRRDESC